MFGALYRVSTSSTAAATLPLTYNDWQGFGPAGLLAFPFVSIVMEKSIYDTLNSFCGIDPHEHPETGAKDNPRGAYTFPSGGHMLPSFSLVPVRKVKQKQTGAAAE